MRELLQAHFREAEDSADEDGKFCIGFRATFDRGASPTKLKVVCRITKAISDRSSRASKTRSSLHCFRKPPRALWRDRVIACTAIHVSRRFPLHGGAIDSEKCGYVGGFALRVTTPSHFRTHAVIAQHHEARLSELCERLRARVRLRQLRKLKNGTWGG